MVALQNYPGTIELQFNRKATAKFVDDFELLQDKIKQKGNKENPNISCGFFNFMK